LPKSERLSNLESQVSNTPDPS